MIMLVWILPFLAPKRPAIEYCSRCRCEMKQGRRVPSRARTLPMGEVIHCSPIAKGVHSAVRINGQPITRPKGHIRSSSAHQVLTMRAIADRGMSRTSTELPAGRRSPKATKVSAKTTKHFASGNGGVSFNDPFAKSNSKSSKRMTLPKVSSSPSLQLFRDAKASMKKNSFESSAKKNSFDSSAKKNSFDSDTSASSGKDSSTGKDSSASSTSTIGKDSSMSRKEFSITKDATPSKMTLVSSTLNAAFDASVAVPVKAAKSSLASAGKASLASANKASMRISNFAKLQRMNPMAPSPVATPVAVDMPASILSSSPAMTVSSSSATTISSATSTAVSSATMILSASGQATFSSSAAATFSESPTSILPEATILPEAAKVSSSWGPFVDVVPPTPQMFSEGTFDGPVAPGLMGFAASDTVGYAASSVSLDERRGAGCSLDADAGDASSKRYSI
ncbi:uncharacterized protein SCHCODRAFT_02513907 [Schizophyllum commune H4-8]|nr:uncharacterized protein SCHCODRAFT_02513907 [Schizophyllum commune H4-8]KAI5887522.1 hypothetical protein SCHCODRAFT_02513907 [Schizophyllum commune H4-8]